MAERLQFNQVKQKPLVMVSALDWGLGHTTRCIPIIKAFIDLNCSVIIACNGLQKRLLEAEFPDCRYVFLEGYNIGYGRTRISTKIRLIMQVPGILKRIRKEQQWLETIVLIEDIKLIVSDNRYGLYSRFIPSVIITHQLAMETGYGTVLQRMANALHRKLLNRFSACWVPDFKDSPNAAGNLSHPSILPRIPITYIGSLSRLSKLSSRTGSHILILLSGPEPQRTLFEQLLYEQAIHLPDKIIFVRGTSVSFPFPATTTNLTFIDLATSEEINFYMNNAKFVIARAGYTTIMDILKTESKAVLVPTPGQTEQEYLGKHLLQSHLALTIPQSTFNLQQALRDANTFPYQTFDRNMDQYRETISALVTTIS